MAVRATDVGPDRIAEPHVPAVPAARASAERAPHAGAVPPGPVPLGLVLVGPVPPGLALVGPGSQEQVLGPVVLVRASAAAAPEPGWVVPVRCALAVALAASAPPVPELPVLALPVRVPHEQGCPGAVLSPRGAVSPQGLTGCPFSVRPEVSTQVWMRCPVSARPAEPRHGLVRPPSGVSASAQRNDRGPFSAPCCPVRALAFPAACRSSAVCRRAPAGVWVRKTRVTPWTVA